MEPHPSLSFAFAALELHVARLKQLYASLLLALVLLAPIVWFTLFAVPAEFPTGIIITIPKDQPLAEIAAELAEQKVISSPRTFLALARITGADQSIAADRYRFARPSGLLTVLWRLSRDETGIDAVSVRLYEGMTVHQMGDAIKAAVPEFDENAFLAEGRPLEGHLFPDTYLIYPGTPAHEVVEMLYANFDRNLARIEPQIRAFDKPIPDILVMASIIEREGRSLSEKRMISGVLWNRIKKGMPLQVDAVFGYIKDVETYSPSFADLKIESPYNTYLNKGLPPTPISNPGYNSLLAAVTPATTTYMYYLTGRDGLMRYATTFEQHKRNRVLYLD